MGAAFTTGVLCVSIHRQNFYFSDKKKKGFLQSFTCTSIEKSIELGKNELDSIVTRVLIEPLLQTPTAATNSVNCVVQTSYTA